MIQDENESIKYLLEYLISDNQNAKIINNIIGHLNKLTNNCDQSFSIVNKALTHGLIKLVQTDYIITQAGLRAFKIGYDNYMEEQENHKLLDISTKLAGIKTNRQNILMIILMVATLAATIILGILNFWFKK